ncbi:MAG: thiol-disulfide oxidoreductase DCC family protein [Gemmatimonadales bacterium]
MSDEKGRPLSAGRRPPLLLYDGDCGFCAGQIQFLLRYDRAQTLRFAPLAGSTAADVLARHPELRGVDSVVWLDDPGGSGEAAAVRSRAVLRAAEYLGGLWRLGALGYIIPGGWRDSLYDLVARHRHQLNGERCVIPTQDQLARFLP